MRTGKLTFITGGVRSGKSSFAEQLARQMHQEYRYQLHYVACGVPSDKEMEKRIQRHKEDRTLSPIPWITWECSTHLEQLSNHVTKRDLLVIDCITTLVNNYLFEKQMDDRKKIITSVMTDISSLRQHAAWLVVVSNEVFQELPHRDDFIQNYQYILGTIHQEIVRQADEAYVVEHGVAICKKGEGF